MDLYDDNTTIIYLIVLCSIIVVCMIVIRVISVCIKHEKYFCSKSALLQAHPLLYGLVGGLFGGLTSIFTKSAGEIIGNLFSGDSKAFLRWESYLLIFGMVCSLLLQVYIY